MLTNEQDVRDVMHNYAKQNPEIFTHNITPDDEITLAAAMGVSAREVNLEKLRQMSIEDGIPLAARIKAGRMMLLDSAKEIASMLKKTATGSDADALAFAQAEARHLMIAQTVSGITYEWGLAGRAFRDLSETEMKEATQITELLQNITGKTSEEIRAKAQLMQSLKSDGQIAKYVNDSFKISGYDKLILYRNRCLLWGPVTHAMVMATHLVNALWRPLVVLPTSAGIGRIAELIKGETIPDRVHLIESKAQIWSMTTGAEKGWRAAADSWNTRIPLKISGPVPRWFAGIPSQIPTTAFGTAIEASTRGITAMHSFFHALRFEQEYQGLIARQALSEGHEGEALGRRIAELDQSNDAKIISAADKTTMHELYMDPVKQGTGLAAIQTMSQTTVGKALFPFVKIEYLIKAATLGEYTPLGLLSKNVRDDIRGANGTTAQFEAIAKMHVGAGFYGIGLGLTAEGILNGSGPSDPQQNRTWRLTHTPYSLQIGGFAMPLRSFGMMGQIWMLAADHHEAIHYAKMPSDASSGDAFIKYSAAVLEHTAHYAAHGTFVNTISDTLDLVRDDSSVPGKINRFFQNYATGFLPFSSGLTQTAQTFDRGRHEIRSEGISNLYGLLDAAQEKIPGASFYVPPSFDMFGNPIKITSNYDLYKDDPVVQTMESLQIGIGRLSDSINGVKLDRQQWGEYSQLAGQLTYQHLSTLVGSPGFMGASPGQKIQQIHRAETIARSAARAVITTNVAR